MGFWVSTYVRDYWSVTKVAGKSLAEAVFIEVWQRSRVYLAEAVFKQVWRRSSCNLQA